MASGERVCSLQYRKVKYRWLSNRSLNNLQLSKTRQWSCLDGDTRELYEVEDDEDAEDTIEVRFDEDGVLDGDWVTEDCEGGPIYACP